MCAMLTVTLRKDATTDVIVPVFAVVHRGEVRSKGGACTDAIFGQSAWFTGAEACRFATEQSLVYPPPNRFVAYDPNGRWLGSWQSGKKMAAFVIAE